MRLYCSPASPFVRKCRIVVREKGMLDQVQEVMTDPYASEPELLAANPIAQVPALLFDDGSWLSDSKVIAACLDYLSGGTRLVPPESEDDHWRVRWTETLADGILEMGVKLLLELRRPENERSPSWMARWRKGLERALDAAEAAVPNPEPLDLGVIALGVAGLWLDFRHPDLGWRVTRPQLAALCDALDARPSFMETRPR